MQISGPHFTPLESQIFRNGFWEFTFVLQSFKVLQTNLRTSKVSYYILVYRFRQLLSSATCQALWWMLGRQRPF